MNPSALASPLPPEWYWQPEHLDRERQDIFHENWIFAGFTDDLAEDNDYISFSIAGVPVIARNMKGKLVAFKNICSHRHSLIHPPGCGNDMFRCQFHGWTYNVDGVPIGVPDNARSFGFEKADKCKLALQQLSLETCGKFVFVRFAEKGPSLKEWLGPLFKALKEASGMLNKVYARAELNWKCNWKIGLEITLEGYHLPTVHPQSFAEHIGGGKNLNIDDTISDIPLPVISPDDFAQGGTEYFGPHSFNTAPLSDNSMEHLLTVAKRLQLQRIDSKNYDHYLIYPNLMIGINGGTNMCVERYEPVSPDQTKVECWLLTAMPFDESLHEGIIWNTITKQWRDWTLPVLGEDQVACENAQAGVRFATRHALLGRQENRVRHYQKSLRESMTTETVDEMAAE